MKKSVYILFILIFTNLSIYANNLRIELKELSTNLNNYKILDARSIDNFNESHIKKAQSFPSNLTFQDLSIDGKITEPKRIQKIIRERGIDINDKIVIYDDGTFFDASRVFWTLEVYGFKNLKLLNGGFDYWDTLGFQTSTKLQKVLKSNYIISLNNKRLATKFSTQLATRNKSNIIIDARKNDSYIGKKSVAKRFGHIPKAINIPAVNNIKTDLFKSSLKDIDELKDIYKNINKDNKVIIYCAVGKIATANYFALRELGYDVANYDSSWKEWGNDINLPIVNLSKKD